MSTVYLVNLFRLTFKTPKKSSLLSPPLCSSNVRVCFHTMRLVSTVRNTFLKSSLSILFRLLHFPVPRFQRPRGMQPSVSSGTNMSYGSCRSSRRLLIQRILANEYHILSSFLPPESDSHYNLRKKRHDREFFLQKNTYLFNCNFIVLLLYKDCY